MTFVRRQIEATIVLGTGNFGDGAKSNTAVLTGHRISCSIVKGVSPSVDLANIRIWGMTPVEMNAVSRLGKPINMTRNNTIQIKAGDDTTGLALVFQGVIQNATQDLTDSPNTCLTIGAQAGALSQMAPVQPISFKGSADVATLMTTVAGSMQPPLSLENNGVNVTLSNPYFAGTAVQQMEEIAAAANCYAQIDSEANVLAIWPKDGTRTGQAPLISKNTTLVGPPAFADVGISLKSLFFPGVRVGGQINLTSVAVPAANGTWRVMTLQYNLESEMPGGAWFMEMICHLPFAGVPQ